MDILTGRSGAISKLPFSAHLARTFRSPAVAISKLQGETTLSLSSARTDPVKLAVVLTWVDLRATGQFLLFFPAF